MNRTENPLRWSERMIGRALATQTFQKKYLVVVPNCNWTGYEADLLAVTENLRLIDVEIKISRSDLKADAAKDKWIERKLAGYRPDETHHWHKVPIWDEMRREWPRSVWRHYYALPAEIWTESLFPSLGSPASGVLTLSHGPGGLVVKVARKATPNKAAQPISAASAVNLARLASLRMWEAYAQIDSIRTREAA